MSQFRTAILTAAVAMSLIGRANAADKVTFLTSWFAEAEHGGFYQAKATGLYAVRSNAMPPGNVTEMTGEERATLAAWIEAGAPGQ